LEGKEYKLDDLKFNFTVKVTFARDEAIKVEAKKADE
jgi:hypothetical protein